MVIVQWKLSIKKDRLGRRSSWLVVLEVIRTQGAFSNKMPRGRTRPFALLCSPIARARATPGSRWANLPMLIIEGNPSGGSTMGTFLLLTTMKYWMFTFILSLIYQKNRNWKGGGGCATTQQRTSKGCCTSPSIPQPIIPILTTPPRGYMIETWNQKIKI